MGSTQPVTWADLKNDLAAMIAEDMSRSQMALHLNARGITVSGKPITKSAVIGACARLGLGTPGINGAKQKMKPRSTARPLNGAQRHERINRLKQARGHRPLEQPEPGFVEPEIELLPQMRRLSLVQLGDKDCRWPCGDPSQPGFFFCGAPVKGEPRYPYCRHHHLKAMA